MASAAISWGISSPITGQHPGRLADWAAQSELPAVYMPGTTVTRVPAAASLASLAAWRMARAPMPLPGGSDRLRRAVVSPLVYRVRSPPFRWSAGSHLPQWQLIISVAAICSARRPSRRATRRKTFSSAKRARPYKINTRRKRKKPFSVATHIAGKTSRLRMTRWPLRMLCSRAS